MSPTKSICPICGSKRIIRARHDSDWGEGNSCNLTNSDDCYTEYDLIDEKNEQVYGDIDIYVCKECNCTWDTYDNAAITALAARMKELEGSCRNLIKDWENRGEDTTDIDQYLAWDILKEMLK